MEVIEFISEMPVSGTQPAEVPKPNRVLKNPEEHALNKQDPLACNIPAPGSAIEAWVHPQNGLLLQRRVGSNCPRSERHSDCLRVSLPEPTQVL